MTSVRKERYEFLERLTYTKVLEQTCHKGLDKTTNSVVMIRTVNCGLMTPVTLENVRKEIGKLSHAHSTCIVQCYGSFITDVNNLSVVMEYVGGGSLFDLIQNEPIDEVYIAIILREVLKGLDDLHSAQILHGNIELSNILLSLTGEVKLTDLGSRSLDELVAVGLRSPSPTWTPPEIIHQAEANEASDIWMLGIAAIEMASCETPYANMHPMRAMILISRDNIPSPSLEGNFSQDFKDFVSKCLQKDPELRPTAKELLSHPFIKQAKDISCLQDLVEKITKLNKFVTSESNDHKDDEVDLAGQGFSFDNLL
eukprot:TRINITY_DN8351_c0_g1_i1.p1 TRINITY_DN8351_c0_g1~~TRINITY_DN8351_c0_g1_i1.p1  ORF type:complete len:312 (-),score=68.67 TRINITY_DN8351_c0_g1_i1:62-997(-)